MYFKCRRELYTRDMHCSEAKKNPHDNNDPKCSVHVYT